MFEVQKGTKQEDALSSVLFNSVFTACHERRYGELEEEGYRDQSKSEHRKVLDKPPGRRRCHVDFGLLEQCQEMMNDFRRSTQQHGLKIHLGKTKILTNQTANRT